MKRQVPRDFHLAHVSLISSGVRQLLPTPIKQEKSAPKVFLLYMFDCFSIALCVFEKVKGMEFA